MIQLILIPAGRTAILKSQWTPLTSTGRKYVRAQVSAQYVIPCYPYMHGLSPGELQLLQPAKSTCSPFQQQIFATMNLTTNIWMPYDVVYAAL